MKWRLRFPLWGPALSRPGGLRARRHSGDHWRLTPRELLLIFVFWTSLATLTAVNRMSDPRGPGFRVMSPTGPIAMAYVESWLWAVVTPGIFWLSSRFSGDRTRWWIRVPVLIIAGVAVAVIVSSILFYARVELFEMPGRRPIPAFAPMREIGRFRWVNQLLVYFAVLAAGFAREYFMRDRQRAEEAARLQAHAARLEAQLAGARLDALRMQLNPHFLFNTLHAVAALVERDPSGVRRMIARLSELLRHTTDSRAADEVSLRDELAFLRRYVEIMEIRFQGRLHVDVSADDSLLDALVPNLILQPLVENALEHGVSRVDEPGRIAIRAFRDGPRLVLSVEDNGPGPDEAGKSGVGLANTRARLAQLYGDEATLSLGAREGGGTAARIGLPYHTS